MADMVQSVSYRRRQHPEIPNQVLMRDGTTVTFKRLSSAELDDYLAHDEWRGKAGAYAIQGHAARFVKSVNGSPSNVIGLPLCECANMLQGNGYVF